MRLLTLLLFCGVSATALAAPPTAEPLDTPPPPPAMEPADPEQNVTPEEVPEVTITKQTEQTIEEYRVGGRLYMIKITPKHGAPYYLVDDKGDGKFARMESLDSGLRVPRWVLHRF